MKKNSLFILILLAPVFIVGCQKTSPIMDNKVGDEGMTAKEINQVLLDQLPYKSSLTEIMAPFWESQNPVGLKDKILELRVPKEDLDIHLDLVIALELIEQGRDNFDQDMIEEGLEKINQLGEVYQWLKSH